jgi:pyruvate dehydrogenase E1 component alpha subunit
MEAVAVGGRTQAGRGEALERATRSYRAMLVIRRFEEECARAYAQGKIGGFLHLYIGQEAIAVGGSEAMQKGDYVITTYRDHGHALARGMSSRAAMAELFGKETGCSRGLGGSMHMFDVPNGMLGGHGIVGGHVALAAGVAFKCKYLGENRVTLCYFGDGATNIGGFHEGVSLAALWKLPAVFICENNEYSMGTPLERTLPVRDITARAEGYGIYRDRIEGSDCELVRERVGKAIEHARSGKGPALLEILTYRFRGHSMSDPGKYRTPEEVEQKKQRDPVVIARKRLLELGKTEAQVLDIDTSVEEEVQDAVKFADESPETSFETMMATVYAANAANRGDL